MNELEFERVIKISLRVCADKIAEKLDGENLLAKIKIRLKD